MEKADFIKFCQDTKLLDFTARKCVAKMDMGPKKKEENPNEKVKKCGPTHKYVSIFFRHIEHTGLMCLLSSTHQRRNRNQSLCKKR